MRVHTGVRIITCVRIHTSMRVNRTAGGSSPPVGLAVLGQRRCRKAFGASPSPGKTRPRGEPTFPARRPAGREPHVVSTYCVKCGFGAHARGRAAEGVRARPTQVRCGAAEGMFVRAAAGERFSSAGSRDCARAVGAGWGAGGRFGRGWRGEKQGGEEKPQMNTDERGGGGEENAKEGRKAGRRDGGKMRRKRCAAGKSGWRKDADLWRRCAWPPARAPGPRHPAHGACGACGAREKSS